MAGLISLRGDTVVTSLSSLFFFFFFFESGYKFSVLLDITTVG